MATQAYQQFAQNAANQWMQNMQQTQQQWQNAMQQFAGQSFDASQIAQEAQATMQQFADTDKAMNAAQNAQAAIQQAGQIMTEAANQCVAKNMQMAQAALEDGLNAAQELAKAKTLEEFSQKQANLTQKASQQAQANCQDVAETWQKFQNQAAAVINEATQSNFNTYQQTTPKAKANGNAATNSKS